MTPFLPGPHGYEAYWEEPEREVLASVAREVAALVAAQAGLTISASAAGGFDEDAPGAAGSGAGGSSASDPFEALAAQLSGTVRLPGDPAVRRLLPDASRDDEDVAAEFRRLTQTDLASAKVRGLELFARIAAGGHGGAFSTGGGASRDEEGVADDEEHRAVVIVPRAEARTVAAALTDVRIVVADRLGLTTDDDAERLHDEVISGRVRADRRRGLTTEMRRYWGGIFVALGFAQESLVSAMLADLRSGRGDPVA